MAAGNVIIQGNVSGGPDGGRTFGPAAITTNAAVSAITTVSMAVGANTVTVPTGATAVIIWPPNAVAAGGVTPNPAFGGTLTLKGVTGDTGVPLSIKWPAVLGWDTAPANFVVTSTATGQLVVWFM